MISVALCTYNGEKYVYEQLKSIVEQSYPVDEIVISDDGSNDGTIDIISAFKEKHTNVDIKIFVNENNVGVTKNFEIALRKCKGDIIFLSDQDDVWTLQKVENTVKAFEEDDQCLLVFSDAYLVDAEGNDMGSSLWERTKPILKKKYTVSDFTGARYITGATVAIKKELLNVTIPIPESWIHDAWLSVNASVYGNVKYLKEKLLLYRQHENNVIGAKKRSFLGQVLYTKANIKKSIEFRNVMRDRFISLNNKIGDRLDAECKSNLQKCIAFWTETGRLNGGSKINGLITIFRHLLSGDYRKFNHGMFGAIVDLFILMNS